MKLSGKPVTIDLEKQDGLNKLKIIGAAMAKNIKDIVAALKGALSANKIVVNLADVSALDARFLGAMLVFKKMAQLNGSAVILTGVSSKLEKIIRLNGADFLLAPMDHCNASDEKVGVSAKPAL